MAKISFNQILEYLKENWTIRELMIFINRAEEVIAHIRINPSLYPYSKESDTHKCVLIKQVSLFYRIKSGQVELLIFWDTRRDPAKLF